MSEEEREKLLLDFSKRQLKKVPKEDDAQNVRVLILDENELQKIDNIDAYLKIEKLSLSKNQLLRMYGVCRLHCLRELNLSFNGILSIEGLKDCIHLTHLNLEGNNIKTIEHLNTNIKLEYLNLSENNLGSISDISFLKNLKELHLHGNRLTHLRQCDKYLPVSLEILTLSKNNINDLNEICTLTNLVNLQSLTINENPCVSMTVGPNGFDGFDHRPFVLNWCMSLKVIDGFVVDPIESLKAEWLYSQGRGRQFRLGEQAALAKYLSSVCPLIGKALENENERKLRLILSKAQHHQRQLQEEISENSNNSGNNSPSSARKKPSSRIQSPRFSRLSGRQGSPDSMISSYHGNTNSDANNSNSNSHAMQMTTSLIENIKNESHYDGSSVCSSGINSSMYTKSTNSQESTPRTITPNAYNEQSHVNPPTGGPLAAASKMVPVPETLMSPDVCPASVAQRVTVSTINTQLQNSKIAKNKDNKMNSPKMRSPHLKRNTAERSPNLSPRKLNNKNLNNTMSMSSNGGGGGGNGQSNGQNLPMMSGLVQDNQNKSRYASSNNKLQQKSIPDTDMDNLSSDDDSVNMNVDKLRTIRNTAAQRCQQQKDNNTANIINHTESTESSAVVIQKIWRGYRTRKKTKDIAEKLLRKRTQEYIEKLTKDMEMTKAQLENERKIQQLQMQAINALWKRVSTMQTTGSVTTTTNTNASTITTSTATDVELPSKDVSSVDSSKNMLSLDNSSAAVVNDLTKTCGMLTNQVQQLQGSMRDILNCLTLFCNLPQDNVKKLLTAGVAEALAAENQQRDSAGTQTEIVAVHTPQVENFPFASKVRPSTLPLEAQQVATTSTSSNNVTKAGTITDSTIVDAEDMIDDSWAGGDTLSVGEAEKDDSAREQ